MSKRDKYAPNYGKLYPGVAISPIAMRTLDQSDRKMQYFELDLKTERKRINQRTKAVTVSPAREDSLDRLTENNEGAPRFILCIFRSKNLGQKTEQFWRVGLPGNG